MISQPITCLVYNTQTHTLLQGSGDGEDEGFDPKNPFAVKLKKAKKAGGGDEEEGGGEGGAPKLKRVERKLLEKGLEELEEEMKKISLRKTRPSVDAAAEMTPKLKKLSPEERKARAEEERKKFAAMTEAERAE